MNDLFVARTADISSCDLYRYRRTRTWDDAPPLTFVMLNPSIADDRIDDPTVKRCMGFARREGAGGLVVVNLFSIRSDDPSSILKDPARFYDPRNFDALVAALHDALDHKTKVVVAWGVHKEAVSQGRDFVARASGVALQCLGKTKDGHPRHPLYVRADKPLEPYP